MIEASIGIFWRVENANTAIAFRLTLFFQKMLILEIDYNVVVNQNMNALDIGLLIRQIWLANQGLSNPTWGLGQILPLSKSGLWNPQVLCEVTGLNHQGQAQCYRLCLQHRNSSSNRSIRVRYNSNLLHAPVSGSVGLFSCFTLSFVLLVSMSLFIS